MTPKERPSWAPIQKHTSKQLLRNTAFFAAVSACLGVCAWMTVSQPKETQSVMSHLTTGFEYDDSIGRLQFVSNILPESAMVFLNADSSISGLIRPSDASITHVWSEEEPWLEYACTGDIAACQAGEVVTIVANRQGESTVRMIHENGYESIYSGLSSISVSEYDHLEAGMLIGAASGTAAFELRKDGLSVLPVFSEIYHEN